MPGVRYVALACDDEELAARLRGRPSWRDRSDETVGGTIGGMQQFDRRLKASAAAASPPLTLLDTTAHDRC